MTDRELARAIPADELDLDRLIGSLVLQKAQAKECEAFASAARQNSTNDLGYWEEKAAEAKAEASLTEELIAKKREALAEAPGLEP